MHIESYVREGERIVRNVVFIKVNPYNFNFNMFVPLQKKKKNKKTLLGDEYYYYFLCFKSNCIFLFFLSKELIFYVFISF
jgi:hypothetical protein